MRHQRLLANGAGNIQVSGDLHIVVNNYTTAARPVLGLAAAQRREIAALVSDVEHAEKGVVPARVIRGAMNRQLGIRSIDDLPASGVSRALIYLQGWKACANDETMSENAVVAQILRIASICGVLPELEEFSMREFGTSRLTALNGWPLKCVFANAMHRWHRHWER